MRLPLYTTLTWLWALFILVLTLMPGSAFPEFSFARLFSLDKLVHLIFFFVLCFLMIGSMRQHPNETLRKKRILISILVTFVYGLSLETLQYFIPGRNFDPLDVIANTAGSLAGGWMGYMLKK